MTAYPVVIERTERAVVWVDAPSLTHAVESAEAYPECDLWTGADRLPDEPTTAGPPDDMDWFSLGTVPEGPEWACPGCGRGVPPLYRTGRTRHAAACVTGAAS